ncbi:hypothetical protein CPB86DRAFT_819779 [Serendipita vermifera]|nr:hypothetical protein CPB86DRAFT_819779 [Serendipita vermifera]
MPWPRLPLMIQTTGAALGRLSWDTEFSISRVDYDISRDFFPTPSPPIHYKLDTFVADARNVHEVLHTIENLVDRNSKLDADGFLVSIPISASYEHRRAFEEASRFGSCDHLHAWIHTHPARSVQEHGRVFVFLFIDLTPGQVTSRWGVAKGPLFGWNYDPSVGESMILGDVSFLNTQSVYNNLVKPIISSSSHVDYVGILRPEGAFPGVSSTDLESMFPNTCVTWVTLDDIAYGAALLQYRRPPPPASTSSNTTTGIHGRFLRSIPIGIMLSNEKVVTVVSEEGQLPVKTRLIFTISQDNQITATVRVCTIIKLIGETKLEGLIPKPKGHARIRVTLDINGYEYNKMTVEDLDTGLHQQFGICSRRKATGIALGRLAYDADFCIVQIPFDGDRSPVSPAVRHKLVNAPTVEDILDRFDELVEPDTKGGLRGFRLSLPISTSPEQWKAFREAMFIHGCVIDHCWGWIESQFPEQFELYYSFLFIDLTPGQVASCSRQKSRYWPSEPTMNGYTTLDDISSLSTRTVYDRLVKSIVPSSIQLDYIGILRPEGAFPDISTTELESMFPNGRVTWLTLDNIAHGTAVTMSKYFYDLPLNEIRPVPTVSIMLANDKLVTVLRYQEDFSIPAKRIFTTSRDNQTTVTIRLPDSKVRQESRSQLVFIRKVTL